VPHHHLQTLFEMAYDKGWLQQLSCFNVLSPRIPETKLLADRSKQQEHNRCGGPWIKKPFIQFEQLDDATGRGC
jgi:hypothetical protein